TVGAQLRQSRRADMAQKMTQGLVDRQGLLLGLSQPIEVVQHPERIVAQGKIQLAAAAQFQAEQEQSPPAEKAGLIIHHRWEARVGKGLEPGVEPGPEMADRFDEGAAQL